MYKAFLKHVPSVVFVPSVVVKSHVLRCSKRILAVIIKYVIVAAVKRLSVHHHSAYCIFWFFGIIDFIFSHLKIRVPLKPGLGGVARVVHFITGHEQTQ